MEEQNNIPETSMQGIDIKKYLFTAISHWYLFVISITISFFIAKWVNDHAIPTYGLHATVLLKSESNEDEVAGGLTLFNKRKNIDTQKGILQSFSLSKETVKELEFDVSYFRDERFRRNYEIYKKSPFVINFDTSFSQYLYVPIYIEFLSENEVLVSIEKFDIEKKIKIGEQFSYKNFNFSISHRNSLNFDKTVIGNKYFVTKNSITDVTKNFLDRLQIDVSPEKSSILWLWLEGAVPQKDADYMNRLIDIYIRNGLEDKNKKASSIIEFIDKQLEGVSDSLRETESNMQIFKQQNKTVDISNEGMILLNRLTEFHKSFEIQKKKLAYYKYLYNQFLTDKNVKSFTAPSVMNINDPVLLSYLEKLSETVTERDILDFSVKNDIPISEKLDLKIRKIQNQIFIHAKKNIEVTERDVESIRNNIIKVNKDIKRLPVSERRIINIERKFNINDAMYTLLLTRRMEAAITQASNKADTKILDKARPELASKKTPDTGGNKKKGILFGLLIPILIVILLEFLNNKIEDKSDIESRTTIPIYGTVGKNLNNSSVPVITFPKSPISESFRAIRTNLHYILKNKSNKIIAVTSSVSGEGKSFVSMNLACVLSIAERKTLLVGLDLRKPKLQDDFNYNNENGISSFLVERANYNEVIQKTTIPNLYIALSGPVPPNPAELIESDNMKLFFEKAVKEFDYIIIDTPPVAVVTDALLMADIADAYLYVMRQNYSSKNIIKLVNDIKRDNKLKNLGIILNEVQTKRAFDYSHGYGYGYGYGDGQGYYDEFGTKKESFIKRILNIYKKKNNEKV